MRVALLAHLAILVLPAPIIIIGALGALRALTWVRGLMGTALGAVVASWIYLHVSDFAFACIGPGCGENWLLRGYLMFYGTAVVGGLLASLLFIPIILSFTRKWADDAPPA